MYGISAGILIFPLLISVIIYVIFRVKSKKKLTQNYYIYDIIFILYCHVLIGVLYFPIEIYTHEKMTYVPINIIPFKDLVAFFSGSFTGSHVIRMIIYFLGNLLMFVPFSFYLTIRFPEKEKRRFILLVSVSVCAEILQFVFILLTNNVFRIADITDLILNVSGAVLSWILFSRKLKDKLDYFKG